MLGEVIREMGDMNVWGVQKELTMEGSGIRELV